MEFHKDRIDDFRVIVFQQTFAHNLSTVESVRLCLFSDIFMDTSNELEVQYGESATIPLSMNWSRISARWNNEKK